MAAGKALIPLSEAAYLAVRRLSPWPADDVAIQPDRLDTAAIVLAVHVPIYTAADSGELRQIDQEALISGRFRGGAQRLAFHDDRPPIASLLVVKEEALNAIEGLPAVHVARALN